MDHEATIDDDVLGAPKDAKIAALGDPKIACANSKRQLIAMKEKNEANNLKSKQTRMFNQELHFFLFNKFQDYRDG
jgi:hypothetical protein